MRALAIAPHRLLVTSLLCSLVAVFFTILLVRPALAQVPYPFTYWQNAPGITLRSLGGPIPEWDINVGGGAAIMPQFEGSKSYQVQPSPAIDIRYKDLAFFSVGEGLGYNIIHGDTYRAGVAVSYDVGRSPDTTSWLAGTGNVHPALEPKLFAEAAFLPLIFFGDIRRQVGGTQGLLGDLAVYMPVVGNETIVVFVGPEITVADRRYTQGYFGIDQQQARPFSQFRTYDPNGGITHANFGLSVDWQVIEDWHLAFDAAYERLTGSAAESPLVQTKNAATSALNLVYGF
jgi:outer membrane scaffolding protein for murein synthesis (MipA/OmpV family)